MSTNLDSCFYTCRRAIPLMVHAKQGRIINISSVWGQAGASMEAAYSASKGGVNSLTKALAKELAPSNIQVKMCIRDRCIPGYQHRLQNYSLMELLLLNIIAFHTVIHSIHQ